MLKNTLNQLNSENIKLKYYDFEQPLDAILLSDNRLPTIIGISYHLLDSGVDYFNFVLKELLKYFHCYRKNYVYLRDIGILF